jgi:ribose/xylose/arabinose/galactoside ABC-type transport system permease subunit
VITKGGKIFSYPDREWRSWSTRLGLVIALLVIGTVLSILRPQFLTYANLLNVARQISLNGILAVGVTYALLTGGVDLSVGSVVALAGVVAASLAHPGDYPVIVPVAMGILTGTLCGATNGTIIAYGRMAPLSLRLV